MYTVPIGVWGVYASRGEGVIFLTVLFQLCQNDCPNCTCLLPNHPGHPRCSNHPSNESLMPPLCAGPTISRTKTYHPSSDLSQNTLLHFLGGGCVCEFFRKWRLSFAGNPGEKFLETLAEFAIGQNIGEEEMLRAIPFVLTGAARAWTRGTAAKMVLVPGIFKRLPPPICPY